MTMAKVDPRQKFRRKCKWRILCYSEVRSLYLFAKLL